MKGGKQLWVNPVLEGKAATCSKWQREASKELHPHQKQRRAEEWAARHMVAVGAESETEKSRDVGDPKSL